MVGLSAAMPDLRNVLQDRPDRVYQDQVGKEKATLAARCTEGWASRLNMTAPKQKKALDLM